MPPKDWQARRKDYKQVLNRLEIDTAEYQTLMGRPTDYFFQCQNQPLKERLSLAEFQEMAKDKAKEIKGLKTIDEIEAHVGVGLLSSGSS